MEEFEGYLLKGLITLSIIFGCLIIIFLAKQIISIVPTGKRALFPSFTCLQSLLKLFPSQVIPPRISILSFQISDIYWRLFRVHHYPVFPEITLYTSQRTAILSCQLSAIHYLPWYLRQHRDIPGVHVQNMKLCDCERVRQHVLYQVIPLFLQECGILEGLLLDDIILLVLVEGCIVETELVHPSEATRWTFILIVLRGGQEDSQLVVGHSLV